MAPVLVKGRLFAMMRKATAAYISAGRLQRFKVDAKLPAGITLIPTHGHTPGHSGWLIQSGKDGLLIWGDMVHIASIQIARPDAGLVFDVDSQTACVSRKRIFDRVAADRLRVGGAHLDFPGFGYLARKGTEYRWEADA